MVDFHSFRTNYQDKSEPGGFYQKPGTNIRRNNMNKQIDAGLLLRFVERIENLQQDMENIQQDIKTVMDEAKSAGYEPKYIKQCIKLRAKDPDQLFEEDELIKMYRNAIGI